MDTRCCWVIGHPLPPLPACTKPSPMTRSGTCCRSPWLRVRRACWRYIHQSHLTVWRNWSLTCVSSPLPCPTLRLAPAPSPILLGVLFEQVAAVKLLTVQYKGGGAAVIAVLGGEAKFSFLSMPTALPHVKAGKLKALAITAEKRFEGAPTIPTVR